MKNILYKPIEYHHLSAVTSSLYMFKAGQLKQHDAARQVKETIANDFTAPAVPPKVFLSSLILYAFTNFNTYRRLLLMTVPPPLYQLLLLLIVNVVVPNFLAKFPRRPSLLLLFPSKTLQMTSLLHLSLLLLPQLPVLPS